MSRVRFVDGLAALGASYASADTCYLVSWTVKVGCDETPPRACRLVFHGVKEARTAVEKLRKVGFEATCERLVFCPVVLG